MIEIDTPIISNWHHKTTYAWTCSCCGKPVVVSEGTFKLLEWNKLRAITCPDCLQPPAVSQAVGIGA